MKFKYIWIFLLLTAPMACQDELEELNQNPNQPEEVDPGVLLTAGTRTMVNTMVNESFLLGNNIAQLTAKTLRAEVDIYSWNAFPTVWDGMYSGLTNVIEAEREANAAGNVKMEAAAMIIRTWAFSVLTDAYGDIPYSEAVQGVTEDNYTPAYDTQEQIYMGSEGLLSTLDEAMSMLGGTGNIEGDIIFDGDPEGWRTFAASLKLRLLMRISNKMDVSSDIQALVSSGHLMESNEDNAILEYLGSFPNEFPLLPLKIGDFDAVALSESSLNVMEGYNDPRLMVYARPDNLDFDNPTFSGAVNGSENAGTCNKAGSRLGLAYFNYPSHPVTGNHADGLLMTYSEVALLLAEAVSKGYISGVAETYYEAGIKASMDYYQVDYDVFGYADFSDYYANSGVAFNGDAIKIWEQQWLALFFTGLEPYFAMRRWLGEVSYDWDAVPFVSPTCENVNDDNLPLRFLYPGQEQSLNTDNYNQAVERLGGNSQNAAMWLAQ